MTSSFGVSTGRLGDSVQTILERADACLYRAKETGRNRTCWEDQEQDDSTEHADPVEEGESLVSIVDGVFLFEQDIEVSTSLELTAMKLNAFISSADMQVTHQEQGQLKVRLGQVGFTRKWGSTPERQAIEMDIRFETSLESRENGHSKTRRRVNVRIIPIGKVPNEATFELRCLQMMMQLRSYLMGA